MSDILRKFFFLGSLLIFTTGFAADAPKLAAVKIAKPPVIDGIIDPAEWAGAAQGTLFIDPLTAKPTADQTESWLAYDEKYIYVALYAHDVKPGGIVGREVQPGSEFNGEDTLSFQINPFGNRRGDGKSYFHVNCLNTQSEYISGGRASKREWRGQWTSAVKRMPDGWTVEMRIPWAILNYQGGKSVQMDVLFERFQARTRVHSTFPDLTLQDRWEYSAIWEGVKPPSNQAKPKIEFLAYSAPEYNEGKLSLRSGIDARYPFTKDLTGLLSVNPDFKNIENQIAGIDFTRTERRLDESRPFFNEGGDFFHLNGDFGYGTMFYSRRIEAFDFGAKTFGHIDSKTRIGALTTVSTGKETASVVRITRDIGPKLGYSAFATFLNKKGQVNDQGMGFSAGTRTGNWNFDTSIAGDKGDSARTESAGTASFNYSAPHWFSTVRGEWIEPNFNPQLGYIPWTDRKGAYLYTEHAEEYRTGIMRNFNANVYATNFNQYNGTLQQKGFDSFIGWTTRSDIEINFSQSQTRYIDGLDAVSSLGMTFNTSNRYRRFGFNTESGKRAGKGTRYSSLNASFRTLKKLDLGIEYAVLRYDGTDTRLVGTMGYEISPTQSITARYAALSGLTNLYVAYKNAGAAGAELFIILGDPNADGKRGSVQVKNRVSVKLAWAF